MSHKILFALFSFLIPIINSCGTEGDSSSRNHRIGTRLSSEAEHSESKIFQNTLDDAQSTKIINLEQSDLDGALSLSVEDVPENSRSRAFTYKGSTFPAAWVTALKRGVVELAPELLDDDYLRGKAMSDVLSMCPGYRTATRAQKPAFWAHFMAAISYPESGFKPRTVFREPAPLFENSIGLLQLSTSNGSHGSACRFSSESELKEAVPNLRCGVVIMKNQIRRHHALFTPGYYYYWSVLRNKPNLIRDVFEKNSSQLTFCSKR